MNIPVKVTPPARVKRPWILGAIIAALLAVAAVISLYEFSPGFRCAVEYKPVDKQLCVVKNASLGEITVECHKERSGWGYMLVTSDDMYIQVYHLDFKNPFYLMRFEGLGDDERHAVESYVLDEVVTLGVLRGIMINWCRSWNYDQAVKEKEQSGDSDPYSIIISLSCDGSDERYAYFTVNIFYIHWYADSVDLTLDRATGEITARVRDGE